MAGGLFKIQILQLWLYPKSSKNKLLVPESMGQEASLKFAVRSAGRVGIAGGALLTHRGGI